MAPGLRLLAETSGKNSLVVSQTADVDAALRDLVRSAFGHAGQKCSAASLAIVEAPLYDDPSFRRRLADAVRSLRVGPATDLATMVGPVITAPSGPLARALTTLDDGEEWLVEPRRIDERLWTPGVRIGVRPGSWFHMTECFGPVLGVMRADDLDHGVELQNAVAYGLTGGLHSLDEKEIERWLERVEVGNVYVNRHTTGAIVRRQPFGGWKRSSIGRGAKTGGPDDINRFVTFRRTAPPATPAIESYERWWADRFGREIDRSGLRSEANVFRYRPVRGVIVRAAADTPDDDLAALRAAATVAGVPMTVSVDETDAELAARIATTDAERLRVLAPIDDVLRRACHEAGIAIDTHCRSPTTGGWSCRAGCASRRSPGPATAMDASLRHRTSTTAITCSTRRAATMPPVIRWRRCAERRARSSWRRKPMPTMTTTAAAAPTVPATRSAPPCVWRTISRPATQAASARAPVGQRRPLELQTAVGSLRASLTPGPPG